VSSSEAAPLATAIAVANRSSDNNFIPSVEDIAEEELSKSALTEFYQHGITGESPWFPYNNGQWIRIVYIGSATSNLTYLVKGELARHNSLHVPSLHLPFPSIRPTMPWKPHKDQPIMRWYSKVLVYAGSLPAKDVRDDLVDAFFKKIHPGFPVIDQAEFMSQYGDPQNPPPLLLLQSVLLAGAHVCQHPKVAESRALVKMALFRRAKALFDMHFENDRMNLVQCALLFTWHFEGADDASSNAYYWTGVACRIAFGLGMHRDLGPTTSTRMPVGDTRIWRRVWWTLVQVDVLASLHHGRPSMIDPDECDQSPLLPSDFVEYCGRSNENVNFAYITQNAILCDIILQIMKLSSPGSLRRLKSTPNAMQIKQNSLDSKLAGWYLQLPTTLLEGSGGEFNFWSSQLQLHYNLALLHLYRIPVDNQTPEQQQKSANTCHTAALSIAKVFNDILATKSVERCSFTALTSLLAVAIQMSSEARSAIDNGDVVLSLQAQNRLQHILPAIDAVSRYWPSAEAISKIFLDLLQKLKDQSKKALARLEAVDGLHTVSNDLAQQSTTHNNEETVPWNPSILGGNSEIAWANYFETGESNSFADIETLGLGSWLTMPIAGNQFSD
jgi:transcriptional regulatory protein AMDR